MTRSGLVHSDRTDWDSQSTRLKEVFSAKEIKDYEKSLFNNLPEPLNAETSICNENEIQVDTQADSFSQTRKT